MTVMGEADLQHSADQALAAAGVDDRVDAVGWFYPRGHTGGLFAGGMGGAAVGDLLGGGLADALGTVGGSVAGAHAMDAASGLPEHTFVGVSASRVYLFTMDDGRPGRLFGALDRGSLEVKVHQRVNVRVLELVDSGSGSAVELEGNRIPTTHSGDVVKALTG